MQMIATPIVTTPSMMKSLKNIVSGSFFAHEGLACIPLPPMHTIFVIQGRKDSSGYESSKGHGENVSCIEDRYPRSDLLTRVEQRQDVQRARVEGRFYETKEEAYKDQPDVVLYDCSQ